MLGCWQQVMNCFRRHQSVQYLGFKLIPSYAQFVQFSTPCAIAAGCFDDLMT